jgi:hypothetical protein
MENSSKNEKAKATPITKANPNLTTEATEKSGGHGGGPS